MMTNVDTQRSAVWQDRRSDGLVLLVVLVALVIGWIYRGTLLNEKQTLADEISGLQLEIPATWIPALEEDTAIDLAAIDPRADSAYKSRLGLYSRLLDPDNSVALSSVVDRLVENYTENLTSFQLLALDNRTIQGADTAVLEYAYVINPIDEPFRASLPVVVHTLEYIIYTPTQYWVLTLSADEKLFDESSGSFESIVAAV